MLPQVEAGRAHQVTDILDEHEIQTVQLQVMQGIVHHVGIQVAGAARGDLDRLHATLADPAGIVLGLEVTLDDGDGEFLAQGIDGGLEQGGFTSAGGGHQVDGQYAVLVEVLAVVRGRMIVLM